MNRIHILAAALVAMLAAQNARAIDVTIDTNGWAPLGNILVSGPGAPGYLGTTAGTYLMTGLSPNTNYSVDFTHNPSTDSPDFRFTTDNTSGVASVTTSAYGAGPHTMVTGFTSGDSTLVLNTHSITYNANQGQTGSYYVPGLISSQGQGSAPVTVTALSGGYNVDNLYNTGAGNEDYAFAVDSSGNVIAGTGTNAKGIPYSEFATFSGSDVNVRYETVHFVVDSSDPITINQLQVRDNIVVDGNTVEWDQRMTIGSGGFFSSSFGSYTITDANIVQPDGSPWLGYSDTNDFDFRPLLRYDGYSNVNGFYWEGQGPSTSIYYPGNFPHAYATATGFFDGNTVALVATANAFLPFSPFLIPEPSTGLMMGLALVGLGCAKRRRKRHNARQA